MDISIEEILSTTIQLNSSDIFKSRNIDGIILHKLKKYEGKCNKNGYIVKDSTELIDRQIGKIVNIDNKSLIEYKINYKIKSIVPTKGDIYECIIKNITKMGLICYVKYGELDELKNSPILVIVPKEYCDIEKQKIDSKIKVKLMDKRIKYMNEQIQIIGEIAD